LLPYRFLFVADGLSKNL
jgi:hypothetical protein